MSGDSPKPLAPAPLPTEWKKDWKFYSGMAALLLACVMPLLGLAVPLLGLPAAWTAALIGVLIAGGPEVMIVVAAALLGKATMHYFMASAKRMFLQLLLVERASKIRYYSGLTVSLVSFLPLYLYGYFPDLMPPAQARIFILAGADFAFILSIFVMGGEFWEKLRALFVWEGKP